MTSFLQKSPELKKTMSILLTWYRQTLGQPQYWLRLPTELTWFISSWRKYRLLARGAHEKIRSHPVLFQRSAISFDAHYSYQSAWIARRLTEHPPARHMDVSSELRFVMQLSAFFPVTYLEYRPPRVSLTGLTILHASITNLPFPGQSVESLSCLHVLEHIGLGRYGDPIDPCGYRLALNELERVLSPGGRLFLSVPVGKAITWFNAHRIFTPSHLPSLLPNLVLKEFSIVTTHGHFEEQVPYEKYANEEYACGLYLFQRPE
jgi:hypothetical protein